MSGAHASPRAVLLDTCAVIWLGNGDPMRPAALEAITTAGLGSGIHVSPISAWEIGLLARPREGPVSPVQFLPDPETWFARFMVGPGIRPAPFSPAIAIQSSFLPGTLHRDPGDRLIVATARHFGLSIVTRDARILDYGLAGFVGVVAC